MKTEILYQTPANLPEMGTPSKIIIGVLIVLAVGTIIYILNKKPEA